MEKCKVVKDAIKKILAIIGCIWRVGIYYVILLGYYIIGILAIMLFSIKDDTSFAQLFEKTVLFVNENTTFIYVLFSALSIFLYYFLFIREKDRLYEDAGRTEIKKDVALLVFSFGIAAAMIVNMVYNLIYWNINSEMVELSFGEFAIYFLGTAVLAPITEELLFRKVLLTRLKRYISVRRAILISSFLFGLMHGGLFDFVYTFIVGMLLCVLFEKFEKIIYPMLMHIGFNLAAVLIQMVEFSSIVVCLLIVGIGLAICIFTWIKILLVYKGSEYNEIHCM